MDGVRVLVATEPRAYRETITATLHCLRPLVEVVAVDPGRLDHALAGGRPHLLLGSDPGVVERAGAPAWVLLYPDASARVEVCVGGRREAVGDFGLDRILALVDEVGRLAGAPRA